MPPDEDEEPAPPEEDELPLMGTMHTALSQVRPLLQVELGKHAPPRLPCAGPLEEMPPVLLEPPPTLLEPATLVPPL